MHILKKPYAAKVVAKKVEKQLFIKSNTITIIKTCCFDTPSLCNYFSYFWSCFQCFSCLNLFRFFFIYPKRNLYII